MPTYTGERLLWLPDVISREFSGDRDVKVVVRPGWDRRGSVTSTTWTFEARGIICHDTGSGRGSSYGAVLRWCETGSPAAPLCQLITSSPWAPDTPGRVEIAVLASGRCNHAGVGLWQDWLSNSSGTRSTVGNHKAIGIEHFWTPDHSGVHPLHREVQLRLDACLLEHLGLDEDRQVDHKEYAKPDGRKQDRRYISQPGYRAELAGLLAARSGRTLLRRGDRGPDVAAVQLRLVGQGYQLEVDGVYGATTEAAVTDFQQVMGIEADGVWGPQTATAMDHAEEHGMPLTDETIQRIAVALAPVVEREARKAVWDREWRDFVTGEISNASAQLFTARRDAFYARRDAAVARALTEEAAKGVKLSPEAVDDVIDGVVKGVAPGIEVTVGVKEAG